MSKLSQSILFFICCISLQSFLFVNMNSRWNNNFSLMCNPSATTRAISSVASASHHSNCNSSCASVNNANRQLLLSSASNTVSNIDDDKTQEKKELYHQRLVFVLLAMLLSLIQKIK